jgi:tetratricopeptide (TPR) repeat protein
LAVTLSDVVDVLWYQEKLDEALFQSTRAMQIIMNGYGAYHSCLEPILDRMGGILRSQGKYEEALPVFKAALLFKEKRLGRENLSAAHTLDDLANLYENMGEYHEALRRCKGLCVLKKGSLKRTIPTWPRLPPTWLPF